MDSPAALLSSGSFYEIVDEHGIARCVVTVPPELTPAEGAQAAEEMSRYIEAHILVKGSAFAGLILDVRKGPRVFGPHTRAALERLFQKAEANLVPLVALVRDNPLQRMQFGNLSRQYAVHISRVVDDEDQARRCIHSLTT